MFKIAKFSLPRNTSFSSLFTKKQVTIVVAISVMIMAIVAPGPKRTNAADKPWSQKAISSHIDQSLINGTLSKQALENLINKGEKLFAAKFTSLDGAGRPLATQAIIPTKRARPPKQTFDKTSGPDANSCAGCHNDPRMGGAGEFSVNVFASQGFTNQGAQSTDPQFSNERNTNHLFGAGLLELLAREMSQELQNLRTKILLKARKTARQQSIRLITKGVDFGILSATADGLVDLSQIEGIDTDLVIRPFSQKGVMTSLRQFTINALNHHHGMQAIERFGPRWTGEKDFDGDKIEGEMTPGDVSALVAWQATLAPPNKLQIKDWQWQLASELGSKLFAEIGCSSCHKAVLPLKSLKFHDPGPMDAAGTLRILDAKNLAIYDLAKMDWIKQLSRDSKGQILVPLFGDLKRHTISDGEITILGNELLSQRFVARNEFITAELWGIASTSPYGHRGDITTLDEIIQGHGGDARQSRDKYMKLIASERDAIIAFLKTLVIDNE